jgi:hypothetical protein
MSSTWPAEHIPLPHTVEVALTVRENGTREGQVVARLTLTDVLGEARSFDVDELTLAKLVADTAAACLQLVRSAGGGP